MQISKEIILKDFERLKRKASLCLKYHLYSYSCSFLEIASKLMYNSSLTFYDDEIEEIIHNLSSITIKKKSFLSKKNRIVFYDCFAWDNRGLTEQYMDSLVALNNYEILYICNHRIDNKGTEIRKKLNKSNVSIYEISNFNNIKKSKELYNVIISFTPEIILVHNEPADISGLLAVDSLQGVCKRYLINITDHTYWPGTKCFDYFFEWRDYGYNISHRLRKLPENKLFKLPYYPIINTTIPFQGFPFDYKDKKVIFSGGSLYKLQGSNIYFEIVKHILTKFEDTLILYLGNGDSSFLQNFIRENSFQNRFYYFNERKDIYQVMKHSYLYLNTYPVSGGLMTQLACFCGKLPITYNENRNRDNAIDELFIKKVDVELIFYDLETLFSNIDKYIQDNSVKKQSEEKLTDVIISKEFFSKSLEEYLQKPINQFPIQKYMINSELSEEINLTRFSNDNKSYYRCFLKKEFFILFINFKYLIKYVFLYAINKLRK